MSPRAWITLLIGIAAMPCIASASVIYGAPQGGPVTVHDGSFGIDANADGTVDLTLIDQAAYGPGVNNVAGSGSYVQQAQGTGLYRGGPTGGYVTAMEQNQQVGPSVDGNFVYSVPGLISDSIIHEYYSPTHDLGDPVWVDGQHHFLGIDVLSGADHHYGWVELSLEPSATPTSAEPWYDVTVYGWAIDTTPIELVTIPEPSSVGVMLLFVVSAGIWRRRRSIQASRGYSRLLGVHRRTSYGMKGNPAPIKLTCIDHSR